MISPDYDYDYVVRKAFKATLWSSDLLISSGVNYLKDIKSDFLSEIKTNENKLSFYGLKNKDLSKDIVFGVSLSTILNKPSSDGFLMSKPLFEQFIKLDNKFEIIKSPGGLPIDSLNEYHFDLVVPSATALVKLGVFFLENIDKLEKVAVRKNDYSNLLIKYDKILSDKIKANINELVK